jgi:hypothetical protein
MPVRVFLNKKGVLTEMENVMSSSSSIKSITGLWQCVSLADVDRDGDLDILAGNLGLNSLLKNRDTTALRLIIGVTSDDGKKEPLLARMEKDNRYYPVPGWLALSKEMPERFPKAYPTASKYEGVYLEELINDLELEWDDELMVNQLASLYFENKNGKEFTVRMLPDEIQYSSVYAINISDVNGDEYPDLITGGNALNMSPDQGANMASVGLVAVGDQKGFFKTMASSRSGLMVTGEVRNIKAIRVRGEPAWLFARNNDSLKLFQPLKQMNYVKK